MKCDDCNKEDDSVIETLCPYAEDVQEESIEVKLCDYCYQERCYDI